MMDKEFLDMLMPIDPFNDEFVNQEIRFMELDNPETIIMGDVQVAHAKLTGRCDDYLNQDFKTGTLSCPRLFVNNKLWMSLTPMEIESNFLPWFLAQGKVATGGLGLGYFTLRAAAKDDVDSVTVYESNSDVIEYFMTKYRNRPELNKIVIIHGDIERTLKDQEYDFFYNDIYEDMLPDEVINDMVVFTSQNELQEYRFWGEELVKYFATLEQILDASKLTLAERAFFLRHIQSDKPDIPRYMPDTEFLQEVVDAWYATNLLL